MKMSVHLNFGGNCKEAFDFYSKVFKAETPFSMNYGQAPDGGSMVPDNWKDKVMHTSIPLGSGVLMGCDAPPGRSAPMGGFQVCVEDKNEAEVRRIFDALSDGGIVAMPIQKPFWAPLFGMVTDKFGVNWMVSVPGEHAP